jgi:hypothetical protein
VGGASTHWCQVPKEAPVPRTSMLTTARPPACLLARALPAALAACLCCQPSAPRPA